MKLNSDSECQMPNERYIFNPHKVVAISFALAEEHHKKAASLFSIHFLSAAHISQICKFL